MNIYYVYAYLRQNTTSTAPAGTPYYIGKGKNKRAWENHRHIPVPTNNSLIVILEQNLTEFGALALERKMIRWYGRKDIRTGILINKTDGGEGSSGLRLTTESKQKMSNVRKGKTRTDEWKKKISESLKLKYQSLEFKTKMANAVIQRDERMRASKL